MTAVLLASVCALWGLAAAQEPDESNAGKLGVYERTLTGLASPSALLGDASGALYVAQSDRDRVDVFTADGTLARSIGARGSGDGQLLDPRGLTASGARLFVADSGNHRVVEFDAHGVFVRAFGGYGGEPGRFRDPHGLAASADALYVCDTGNDRVQKLTLDGHPLAQVGARGFGEAQFVRPSDVAVDGDGNVYVTDTGNHRLEKFDRDLRFVKAWGDFGPHPGFFAQPEGLECFEGLLYVVDSDNHRVQVFDTDGARLREWGLHALRPREGEGRLHYPTAIAVTRDGHGAHAAVAEPFEDRVQLFRAAQAGEEIPVFNPAERTVAAHFGPHLDIAGDVLALCEPSAPSLLLYDIEHDVVPWEPIQLTRLANWGRKFGAFLNPTDVAVDWAAKLVYVADADAGTLASFRFAHDQTSALAYDPFLTRLVRSLDFDELHRLGGDRAPFAIRPTAIELGPSGEIWVLDALQRTLFAFTPEFELTRHVTDTTLLRPVDFVFDPRSSSIAVVDELAGEVRMVTRPDREGGRGAAERFGALVRPRAIATDGAGLFCVSDSATASIHVFQRQDGNSPTELRTFGSEGLGPVQFHKPRGLEIDAARRLWVLDWGNHRGQVLGLDGSFVTAFGSRLFARGATKPGSDK